MAKQIVDLKEEMRAYRFEIGLLQKVPCTKLENKKYRQILLDGGTLPEGVYSYVYENGETSNSEFYTVYDPGLTDAEVKEYLAYKQISMIQTIKNCVLFFTILTIISMVILLFISLSAR